MTDFKKVIVNGTDLYNVSVNNVDYECTIERTERDEYMAYNESGKGVSIVKLTTVDIIELLATGSIHDKDMIIYPKKIGGN